MSEKLARDEQMRNLEQERRDKLRRVSGGRDGAESGSPSTFGRMKKNLFGSMNEEDLEVDGDR